MNIKKNDSVWRRHFWQIKKPFLTKKKKVTLFLNASGFVTAEAMIDNENAWSSNQIRRLNTWEVSSLFQLGFSHKNGNHMGYIINNDIMLCCPACGYLSVLELINKHYSVKVSTIFLYILISEASKCHMHKFYRIKFFRLSSNFLTVPCIIKRLLNLYCEIFGTCSYGGDTLASSCVLCHMNLCRIFHNIN